MNFSEFKRLLGAEPLSRDPEFRRARNSSVEFEQAAARAERFEAKLERALSVSVPPRLSEELAAISRQQPGYVKTRRWWPMALAASLLIAVGTVGITWKLNPSWASVEEYLVDHYRHDGAELLARMDGASANEVQGLLRELNAQAAPALAGLVGLIKYCPTPDGKGLHMILNTQNGPVTVFYMPRTEVTDRETLRFDDVEAILVDLQHGSAAIIGPKEQDLSGLYTLVQNSILPPPESS